MRHALLLIALAAVTLVVVDQASANGGPHGGYTGTTDSCAGCHRTHTAQTRQLLIAQNSALCLTCHGTASTGANTDVSDGIYTGTTQGAQNAGLNGGGFANARQDTSLSGTPSSGPVTSLHQVQGMPGYSPTALAWGAGTMSSTPSGGQSFDLYCTSCHDPHGSNNYRMLRSTVNGVPVTVSLTDETTKSYTTPHYYQPAAGAGAWQISTFCAACHTRDLASSAGSGETASGDAIFAYRHRVDAPSGATVSGITYAFAPTLVLPISSTTGGVPTASPDDRSMVCLTCHYAHGTRATMGPTSGAVPWPGGGTTPSGNARSSLLRLDNRGTCENCHNK